MYIYTHTYICICLYTPELHIPRCYSSLHAQYMYECIYACMYVVMYVCMHEFVCVCMCIHVCIHALAIARTVRLACNHQVFLTACRIAFPGAKYALFVYQLKDDFTIAGVCPKIRQCHVCMYVCIYLCLCVCMYVYMYVCVYVFLVYVCMCACMYIHTYVCVYVCVCTFLCIHIRYALLFKPIYIHAYTDTHMTHTYQITCMNANKHIIVLTCLACCSYMRT